MIETADTAHGPLPLVSVGIPVRNGDAHLAEALQSILRQDYRNLEILISDNASTDGTLEICRTFAERDSRIRYWRLPESVEVVANFRRVLLEARGAYFTWLAHDDLLLSPDYVSTIVSFLEGNTDVVLAGSSVSVLDYEGPGTVSPTFLEDVFPDRDWRRVRAEFFRYPYRDLLRRHLHMLIYGVYRTNVLRSVGVADLTVWGRPVAFGMEYPILAALAARGRLVAVPTCVRAYRHRERSVGQVETFLSSRIDLARLGFTLKLKLLRLAARGPLSRRERLRLVATALRNFLSHHLGVPNDPVGTIKVLKQENRTLRAACAERLALIERLSTEIATLRKEAPQANTSAPASEEDSRRSGSPARDSRPAPTHDADNLMVWSKNVDFLHDHTFKEAYRVGISSGHKFGQAYGVGDDLHVEWRVHVCCWAAHHAMHLEGDFVECGVNTGIYSLAVAHFIDLNASGKSMWLFDTFSGIPEDQLSDEERALGRVEINRKLYGECFEIARQNFAPFPRARLVRGRVPESLSTVSIDRVCYLSIDLNAAYPERAALEHFWDKLVPGAPVLLDDYAWQGHEPQKRAMDEFAGRNQVEILTLPTGQGLLLKPGRAPGLSRCDTTPR